MKPTQLAFIAATLALGLPAAVTASASDTYPMATPRAATPNDPLSEALASGQAVEDEAQRTPTERVFANPDGTWTSYTSAEPVRAQDAAGNWASIDLTLQRVKGGYAPAAALGNLVLSSGGDRVFASLSVDGEDISWKWPTQLPAPDVDGASATYHGVAMDGTADLVVTATSSGFRHDIVLNERPTGPVEFPLVIALEDELRTLKSASGDLSVKAPDGQELVSSSPPLMYESGSSVESSAAVPIDTALEDTASGSLLTLTPETDYLTDPSTNFPVTLDPTWNSVNPDDTWVSDEQPNSIHPYDETLHVGSPDSGTTRHRSFVRFETGSWANHKVTSATLRLRNFKSLTCSGSAIEVRRATTSWAPGSTTWNEQPSTTSAGAATSALAKGNGDGCPAGDVTWDVQSIVSGWAASTSTNYGFRVAAVNETANSGYRKFRSAGYAATNPTLIPELSVTYTLLPAAPSDVHALSGVSAPVVAARPYGVTKTSQARFKVEALSPSNSAVVASYYSDEVTSGEISYLSIPGLPQGNYVLRIWSQSEGQTSIGSTSAGTVTVSVVTPSPPVTEDVWSPPARKVDSLSTTEIEFEPSTPVGYSLTQGLGKGEVRNTQGVLVGHFWSKALDADGENVPTTLSVQNGRMTVSLFPTATNVLPFMAGTVFEELE